MIRRVHTCTNSGVGQFEHLLCIVVVAVVVVVVVVVVVIIIIINKEAEMSLCCGIKQYTQTEKLQQIGQI